MAMLKLSQFDKHSNTLTVGVGLGVCGFYNRVSWCDWFHRLGCLDADVLVNARLDWVCVGVL